MQRAVSAAQIDRFHRGERRCVHNGSRVDFQGSVTSRKRVLRCIRRTEKRFSPLAAEWPASQAIKMAWPSAAKRLKSNSDDELNCCQVFCSSLSCERKDAAIVLEARSTMRPPLLPKLLCREATALAKACPLRRVQRASDFPISHLRANVLDWAAGNSPRVKTRPLRTTHADCKA